MSIYENPELTPREYILMEHQEEQAKLAREHAVQLKQLELALQKEKNTAAIELKRLEAKWSSLLRIPALILKLPVFIVLGIGYIVSSIRGIEPGKDFWNYLR